MKVYAHKSVLAVLLLAPSLMRGADAAADPAPAPVDPTGAGGIYGETSPFSGGPNPWASSPVPGLVSGTVPGSNAPLSTELSTGTSGLRPGTNALQPGSLRGFPRPEFPDNYFQAPPESLPGQPEPRPLPGLPPVGRDHQWGPLAQGGDSNPEDPDNDEAAPDVSMARQLEPEGGDDESLPTGDQSMARKLDPEDDE
ncbi:hypothetical protein HMPREF9336_00503 [Segniliparus rugosus ATCC BAA-974]|uniref:Uncharacterized protein n=2 Tax=Segniliparus rugosus TaxID=286804 RepID=E5XLY4_SEGRC|nr:hypothetical protein HMPREF9336_00503 [Segniliparus rugosus ATCC BAA-974]